MHLVSSEVEKLELDVVRMRTAEILFCQTIGECVKIALGHEALARPFAVTIANFDGTLAGQRDEVSSRSDRHPANKHLPGGLAVTAVLAALVLAAFVALHGQYVGVGAKKQRGSLFQDLQYQ